MKHILLKSLSILTFCLIAMTGPQADFPDVTGAMVDTHIGASAEGWFQDALPDSQVRQHYVAEYGYFPNIVLWTGVGIASAKARLSFGFRANPGGRLSPFDPKPEWDEIKAHTKLLIHNSFSQAIDTMSASSFGMGSVHVEGPPYPSFSAGATFDLYALASLHADTVYGLWAEVWEDTLNPSTRVEYGQVDTLYVLKKAISSEIDSLMWSSASRQRRDYSLLARMNELFPGSAYLVENLFWYFYDTDPDCDSLSVYRAQWDWVQEHNPGSIAIVAGFDYEARLDAAIEDICDDGVANEELPHHR